MVLEIGISTLDMSISNLDLAISTLDMTISREDTSISTVEKNGRAERRMARRRILAHKPRHIQRCSADTAQQIEVRAIFMRKNNEVGNYSDAKPAFIAP